MTLNYKSRNVFTNEILSVNKNILNVFYKERVFLYRHGSTEHTVILIGTILIVNIFIIQYLYNALFKQML